MRVPAADIHPPPPPDLDIPPQDSSAADRLRNCALPVDAPPHRLPQARGKAEAHLISWDGPGIQR